MSNLQEFIDNNKNDALNFLKCGGCSNNLFHCGEYEIVKVGKGRGKKSEESIICETCNKNNREPQFVTRVTNNHVFNVPITALDIKVRENNKPEVVNVKPKKQEESEAIFPSIQETDQEIKKEESNDTTKTE